MLVQNSDCGDQAHLTSHCSLNDNFQWEPGHVIQSIEPLFLQVIYLSTL